MHTFNDPEVNACMERLRDLGSECATTFLAAVAELGERGGPTEWEALLQTSLRLIRDRVNRVMAGETDPNAPHAAEAMIEAIETGFFGTLSQFSLANMDPEGSA